jgi:hypothetical protein
MYLAIVVFVTASLVVGAFELPAWYYDVLRVTTCIYCGLNVYLYFDAKNKIMSALFIALGVLFNPILKVELAKEAWMVLDVITAVFVVASGFYYYIKYCGKLPQNV